MPVLLPYATYRKLNLPDQVWLRGLIITVQKILAYTPLERLLTVQN
jgi:hypothetical protein